MRFYCHDGKAAQGPFTVEELLRQPGFGSESIVCPAGSARSEDWKTAISYDVIKEGLLKPKPRGPVTPCPDCGRDNPEDAVFCNKCGARVLREEGPVRFKPLDAGAGMPGLAQPPMGGGPMTQPPMGGGPMGRGRGGGMGRLAEAEFQPSGSVPLESSGFRVEPTVPFPDAGGGAGGAGETIPPTVPATGPFPEQTALQDPTVIGVLTGGKKRKFLLAGAVIGVLLGVVLGIWAWRKAPASEQPPVPELSAKLLAKKRAQATSAPVPSAGEMPQASAPQPKAPQARPSVMGKRSAPAAASRTKPPGVQKTARPSPEAKPAPARPKRQRNKTPAPSRGNPLPMELPGVGAVSRRPAAPVPLDQPPTPDELMTESALEQFTFCHQLIRQGDFGEVFDNCFCSAIRNSPPYNGAAKVYEDLSRENSDASAPFKVLSTKLDGQEVLITAEWTVTGTGPVERTEAWKIEGGGWCQAR